MGDRSLVSMGNGTNAMGLLGGNAGQPCPFDTDAAAMAFVKRYRTAIDWAINSAAVPQCDRADIRQEVAMRVLLRFRKHGELAAGGHASYAITIARHAAMDYFKSTKRTSSRPAAEPPELEARLADGALGPEELLMRKDGHERLHLAIASLTPLKRYVVRRVMEGASMVEVATELERHHGTVKVLHHRAVADLKARLVTQ